MEHCRCKACCCEVNISRERRSLSNNASDQIRSVLQQLYALQQCYPDTSYFSDGYVCKKCFLSLEKFQKVENDYLSRRATLSSSVVSAIEHFNLAVAPPALCVPHTMPGTFRSHDASLSSSGSTPTRKRNAAIAARSSVAKRPRGPDSSSPTVSVS